MVCAVMAGAMTFAGVVVATSAKAILFHGSFWEEAAWVPRSQSEIEVVPDADTEPFQVTINDWLVKKNGWTY